jgi:class 3 adenylate cyclase/streptogramin lyase
VIRRGRPAGRRLATVLFTDMVGSTERAIELGDRAWRELLRRHHRAVRAELRRFGGHEVDSAGDGFFATFPQPADAIRCAIAIRAAVRPLGLSVRSAVHTGEVEQIGPKVGGVAVHLAARALSAAEPDEILVTSTVRDLVAGSELTFADAGTRTFKGFSEPWHVYRVTGPEPTSAAASAEEGPDRPAFSRRSAIALGGVIGAVLVVGVLVLLGVTGQPPGVQPGPNTVHRIDLKNAPVDAVSVARGPAAVAVLDDAVWVASEAGTVTRIDPSDGSTQVVGGIGIPTAMAAGNGSVWVAEGFGGGVSRIDAAAVEVRDVTDLHGRRLAVEGDAVWIADDIADRVVRLSTTTLTEGSLELEAASGPRAIAAAGGSVWVANERAATVFEVDAATTVVVGHPIGLGSTPTDLAVGAGGVWVTSMDADRLYRIDPVQDRVVATIETCDGPDAVVASDDGVWVACRIGQVVRRFGVDGTLVADIAVKGTPGALALATDGVWVALRDD